MMRLVHIDHVDKERCSACEECVHLCPHGCFEMQDDAGSVVAKFVHPERCDFCGKCIMACEEKAIILNDIEKDKYVKVMHPERCEACENCVKMSSTKSYEIVEEDGRIFSKQVSESDCCDDEACCFSCPNEAIVYIRKKKKDD